MLRNYDLKWGAEIAWAVLVAVVVYAGQALANGDAAATPGETLTALAGGAVRVALAVIAGKVFGAAGAAA